MIIIINIIALLIYKCVYINKYIKTKGQNTNGKSENLFETLIQSETSLTKQSHFWNLLIYIYIQLNLGKSLCLLFIYNVTNIYFVVN